MKIPAFLTLLVAPFMVVNLAYADQACKKIFAENESVASIETVDRHIQDLVKMRLNLDREKAEGKATAALTAQDADYLKKETALFNAVKASGIMTREELIKSFQTQMAKLIPNHDKLNEKQATQKKQQVRALHLSGMMAGSNLLFNEIKPGSFKMGPARHSVHVTISKPFALSATLTTQLVWKAIVELAQEKYPGEYDLAQGPSRQKGDSRPVEHVDFNSIQAWISALNRLSKEGDSRLVDILPEHTPGDVYRLPTEAEWEFVVRGRGVFTTDYPAGGKDFSAADKYAWYAKNSNETQPVAQKQPILIEDQAFYDMYGNTHEVVNDVYAPEVPGGQDPQGPRRSIGFNTYVIRGGSFSTFATDLTASARADWSEFDHHTFVGFRLAKDVK